MEKRQTISAYQPQNRNIFIITWTHPKTGKRTTSSTERQEETAAKGVALSLERICNEPALWELQPEAPELDGLDDRAVELFYGRKRTANQWSTPIPQSLIEDIVGAAKSKRQNTKFFAPDEEKVRLRRELNEAHLKVKALEADKADLERELARYRRQANRHVTQTVAEAIEAFEKYYKPTVAEKTFNDVLAANTSFADAGNGARRLGDVRAAHLNSWLVDYVNPVTEETVTQTTKARVRRYASTFWTWATSQYDLSENPISKAMAISPNTPDTILAIRRYEDMKAYIDALAAWPYWQAWLAFALLVGPRWSEQANAKTRDVVLESGYVRIFSRKTGRERTVPIETTLLLPILKKHLKTLDSVGELLFPSEASGHGAAGDGVWRNGTFLERWFGRDERKIKDKKIPKLIGISELARAKCANPDADYWEFSGAEWRHCAGTAFGHCGLSSLQISQWLGNSEEVARRHYIAPVSANPWPLKYG